MPIRAQCDNCGKVYNLPDESGGKRLRCKQCAVAFTVPAATAPAESPTVATAPSTPQKICVVCGQNVAGRPRTKDQAGNYFCRSCCEEKARAREQLAQSRVGAAVPAGVGAGGGGRGDDGDLVDLAALEPTEQFDESAQPPPPPIPDLDFVAPPIPDMEQPMMAEPVVEEAPKPKKKKKKKKAVAVQAASGGSFASKLLVVPVELWVLGIGVILGSIAMFSSTAAWAATALLFLAIGCFLWGKICIALAAFAEGTVTGLLYLFIPFYWLFFILSNWSDVQRHVLRVVLGVGLMIGAIVLQAKHGIDDLEDEYSSRDDGELKNRSTDPAIKLTVDLGEDTPDRNDKALEKREQQVAEAILAALRQRGVKPPEGQKYEVEATVEAGESETEKIKLSEDIEIPAPFLICKLRVKSSGGNTVFDQSRNVTLPPDALAKAKAGGEESVLDKQLWKNVPGEFAALTAQVLVDASPANNTTSTPGNQTPAANNQTPAAAPAAAEAPAEETIRIGVRFHQMLPNGRVIDGFFGDPEKIEPWKEAIENIILTSLEQRGIKPPVGQYYSIEAIVEENWSSVQKIKMANGEEAAAPILICKMRVQDSVGRGNYIFDKGKDIELPADVVAKASRSGLSTFRRVSFIDEALWKDVRPSFKAMADEFKPQGAAAPSGAKVPAQTAAPTETAAPAK